MEDATKDRITVIQSIYHRPVAEEVTGFRVTFTQELDTHQQPYYRSGCKVGEAWEPLDCGWLGDDAGRIAITNEEGKHWVTIPSEKEKDEVGKRIIEIVHNNRKPESIFRSDGWLIPPGESFSGKHSEPTKLWLRCKSGVAKYKIYVFPK